METTGRLDRGDGVELAWKRLAGKQPTLVFLSGFGSDMTGDKASNLAAFCAECGQAMLRFDYSGHGASSGTFEDGSIGAWAADALCAVDRLSEGPLLLVGSSMGGWIALLTALARKDRVRALVGIAAAPDFTEALMWEQFSFEQRATIMQTGRLTLASEYGGPSLITRKLIEDGRKHLLLTGDPVALDCPVRLLHGQADPDVPWQMALNLADQISAGDVQVTLVKDGNHRLSRPQDLALLRRVVAPLLSQDGA